MGKRILSITLSCLCYVVSGAFAQGSEAWLKMERSYLNHFYQEEDNYSKKCFQDIFFDQRGRLWLAPCGDERLINSISLFRFDGYSFQPVEIFTVEGTVLEAPNVKGIGKNGQFFGITEERHLFQMDPDTQVSRIIPYADSSSSKFRVFGLSVEEDETIVFGRSGDNGMALFESKAGKLVKNASFDYPETPEMPEGYSMLVSPESVWVAEFSLPLYRFDREKGTIRKYEKQDFLGHTLKVSDENFYDLDDLPKLLEGPKGNIYLLFTTRYGQLLFQLDREKDRFVSMADQFPADWVPVGIFKDKAGNICFLFQDATEAYRAILQTPEGQRFDYSAIVSGQSGITQLAGKDFRRQVFLLTDNGLSCAGIREKDVIRQTLTDKWISSMASLPDGRILVNTIGEGGWYVYDETTGIAAPFQGPDCGTERPAFGPGMKQQVIPDKKGNLFFISHNDLVRFNPETRACESIDLGKTGTLFAIVREELVLFQHGRRGISFLDLKTRKTVSFGSGIPKTLNGFIRDILVDSKGIIWIPTNNGVWRIDIEQEQSEVLGLENGFTDFRFTSIFEDAEGRLWLGTYFGGLQIYDPQTGDVTIIDQGRGLSSNTIMSIIADDEGDMWVGTEYGINLVSKEGEVLNSFHQEDGLTYEIFERFDPFKSRKGYLYFGTRNGISIINPSGLKAYMKSDTTVKVYLTELRYFDKEKREDVVQRSRFDQIGRLDISPERPYLRLKFGLSGYLEPHSNRYAYKFEGKEDNWHYLSTQPELNISHLPSGKYRLLIKGADFRNNWTREPIAIDVHAREFFYKQPWFYLLAATPFLAFGLIWARDKQQEARRLEREVAQRTQKIREDKALIEQQAAELRQLDTMKSRFFTNISHELRTPITLIKAPLENLIQKHGPSLDEQIGRSLKMVLNNTGKLGRLVEELLELSSLEAKKATLKETATPLTPFCRQLFGAYEAGAAVKNIDYHFHSELEEDAHFLIDRKRLEKIVNNLLSNALKFTPNGGTISMSLCREADQLRIEVQDSGRGIPMEDMPYLFDRYFQTRRDDIATEGGTGIGLALSKELAHLMRGDLTVKSEWGTGACFTLHFPAKEAPPAEQTVFQKDFEKIVQVESSIPAPLVSSNGDAPKLLIVEDNPDMQQLIHTLLADQYDCVMANNGAEAWTWLQEGKQNIDDIELILSDVMMPEMDGYTLLKKIKAHQHWQRLPVVMLTARSAEEDKLQALRMGVDDYLPKPFSPAELKARLHNLIANYRVRKNLAVRKEEPSGEVDITFEPEESAYSIWLKNVEDAAREALDKGLKLSTAFLAERVFLSERQFSRKLKGLTGLTPNSYIQEVKLQKARHLLEHQVYTTVNEVAQAAGYSSGGYLTKVYQERFGKKPSEYF